MFFYQKINDDIDSTSSKILQKLADSAKLRIEKKRIMVDKIMSNDSFKEIIDIKTAKKVFIACQLKQCY